VSELDPAMRALAEVGTWRSDVAYQGVEAKAEALRAQIRRESRKRGYRVRTGLTNTGHYVWALTWGPSLADQCLPADEPWRGAAIAYRASDTREAVLRDALDRAWGGHRPPRPKLTANDRATVKDLSADDAAQFIVMVLRTLPKTDLTRAEVAAHFASFMVGAGIDRAAFLAAVDAP
jgi:hypothetical protein